MNEKHFRRLMQQLDEMSDEEFVRMLESAGMVVEDIPEDADPRDVVIETTFEHAYNPGQWPRRRWNLFDLTSVESKPLSEINSARLFKGRTETFADSFPLPATRYAWKPYETLCTLTVRESVDEVA